MKARQVGLLAVCTLLILTILNLPLTSAYSRTMIPYWEDPKNKGTRTGGSFTSYRSDDGNCALIHGVQVGSDNYQIDWTVGTRVFKADVGTPCEQLNVHFEFKVMGWNPWPWPDDFSYAFIVYIYNFEIDDWDRLDLDADHPAGWYDETFQITQNCDDYLLSSGSYWVAQLRIVCTSQGFNFYIDHQNCAYIWYR